VFFKMIRYGGPDVLPKEQDGGGSGALRIKEAPRLGGLPCQERAKSMETYKIYVCKKRILRRRFYRGRAGAAPTTELLEDVFSAGLKTSSRISPRGPSP
jgi:hypothetical protein